MAHIYSSSFQKLVNLISSPPLLFFDVFCHAAMSGSDTLKVPCVSGRFSRNSPTTARAARKARPLFLNAIVLNTQTDSGCDTLPQAESLCKLCFTRKKIDSAKSRLHFWMTIIRVKTGFSFYRQ